MPSNPLNKPKPWAVDTDSNYNFIYYTNQYWWVGGSGVGITTGSSKDSYDWNNKSNWKVWNPTNGGSWDTSTKVPGSIDGSNDIVFIGGLSFGPTAYAPLLYGGFSGSSTTGGYANGVGLTFTAGTTTNNCLLEMNIKWEYGYEQKYPFNIVGGGLNSLYAMGVTSGTITGASSSYGVTFGNYSTDPHYQSLKVKSLRIKEESSRANNKSIFLNSVKVVNSSGYPVGMFTKGVYSATGGNRWNGGSTSRSKVHLTGMLNEFQDYSRPSALFVSTKGDAGQIQQDYGDLNRGLYGYPEVNLGWNGTGLTLGSYGGHNLTTIVVDNNSTIGKMQIDTIYSYPQSTQNLGLETYPVTVLGEISDKPLSAMGYSLTGGFTGAQFGQLTINTSPKILVGRGGATSSSVNIAIGNYLNWSGVTGVGYTGSARVTNLQINDQTSVSENYTNLMFMGSVSVADATLYKTKIKAWKEAQNSSIDIGILRMNNNCELLLNEAPDINSWSFGLLPDPGATTQVLGGIYADDSCSIKTSLGIVLYNKNVNTAVSSANFIVDNNNNVLFSTSKLVARQDDIGELPLPP